MFANEMSQAKKIETTAVARCPLCKTEFYVETFNEERDEKGQLVEVGHEVVGEASTLAAIAKEHRKTCPSLTSD